MTSDPDADVPPPDRDPVEPARVVDEMAAAIERVRRMAVGAFDGDAELFADPPADD